MNYNLKFKNNYLILLIILLIILIISIIILIAGVFKRNIISNMFTDSRNKIREGLSPCANGVIIPYLEEKENYTVNDLVDLVYYLTKDVNCIQYQINELRSNGADTYANNLEKYMQKIQERIGNILRPSIEKIRKNINFENSDNDNIKSIKDEISFIINNFNKELTSFNTIVVKCTNTDWLDTLPELINS